MSKRNTLYKWELALLPAALLVLLWAAGTAKAQEELAGQMLRIHVIANSDTPEDQALKLAVRDGILAQVADLGEGSRDAAEMTERLSGLLPQLEQTGEAILRAQGCPLPVRAELTQCSFPTRVYPAFSLPAGEYTALRLVIGAGAGENWWCVAFPPLCLGASSQSVEQAVQAGHFTREQQELMTGQYVLRFKSMELLGAVRQWFSRDLM